MRVLFLFCERFRLDPHRKGNAEAEDDERSITMENVVVALIHAEDGDDSSTVTKLLKNAKWVAGKFGSRRILLHSFAHLGEGGCEPSRARELILAAHERLVAADWEADVTPFGYFCRLDFLVHGESMAKIFKSF